MADPVTLTVSATALGVSVATFAWLHLRKVDAVVCTLVANECNDQCATFQFSFANVGTQSALLREIRVEMFMQPELHGQIIGDSTAPAGQFPQVIKAGEMFCALVEVKWTLTDLVHATKAAEARGVTGAELFFVARATLWNPKGQRFIGQKHIATLHINHKDRTSGYECHPFDRSFRVKKISGNLPVPKLVKFQANES